MPELCVCVCGHHHDTPCTCGCVTFLADDGADETYGIQPILINFWGAWI